MLQIKRQQATARQQLNRLFRIPQRINHHKLKNGVFTQIETYKNKQIILVSADINHRYLSRI